MIFQCVHFLWTRCAIFVMVLLNKYLAVYQYINIVSYYSVLIWRCVTLSWLLYQLCLSMCVYCWNSRAFGNTVDYNWPVALTVRCLSRCIPVRYSQCLSSSCSLVVTRCTVQSAVVMSLSLSSMCQNCKTHHPRFVFRCSTNFQT